MQPMQPTRALKLALKVVLVALLILSTTVTITALLWLRIDGDRVYHTGPDCNLQSDGEDYVCNK